METKEKHAMMASVWKDIKKAKIALVESLEAMGKNDRSPSLVKAFDDLCSAECAVGERVRELRDQLLKERGLEETEY